MEKQTTKFDLEFIRNYQKLNQQQKEAVDQIEGPVMVIAGPGTGKTHILAMRIGNIRRSTDAHASNILCLTFTEAGATAMRRRLLSMIGPEAHKIHIFTFHGFCNHIIQQNSELFGGDDMESLSELEQIEIIRLLIDQLAGDSPVKNYSDPYFYLRHLINLFNIIKTENWEVDNILATLDEYLVDLPNRAEYIYKNKPSKGQPNVAKLNAEIKRIQTLKAAVALFPEYQKALKHAKRYDFNDMILWVIEAFEKNESLLRNYQEQYLYFLVDEYQDTNGAQNKILLQLISFWDAPNVFIVGDDDQAIYEFQGARLQSLKDLRNTYEEEMKIVILKENYRSTQSILDASKNLIEKNENRIINQLKEFGFDKDLLAANKELKKNTNIPIIADYPNKLQEYSDIANQIEKIVDSGVDPKEIAVIYAQNKEATLMMSILDKKAIPYTTKKPVNILEERLIRQILDILYYINIESTNPGGGEAALFEILHFPCWNISNSNLTKFALYLRNLNHENEVKIRWREALADIELLSSSVDEEKDNFHKVSTVLEFLMDQKNAISVVKLFELLLSKTGILPLSLSSNEIVAELQLMHTFLDFINEETHRKSKLTLTELLNTVSMMKQHGIGIPLNKSISASNGVLLTTAHSSKGLEFQYVFMVNCTEENWNSKIKNTNQFYLPEVLTSTNEETNGEEAQRRLFYVAMTRAKEFLHISYPVNSKKGRVKFIEEILELSLVDCIQKSQPLDEAIKSHVALLQVADTTELRSRNTEFIKERLSNFYLTPSSLNRYIDCPYTFYYEQVLSIPSPQSDKLSFGNAIHGALEKMSRIYNKTSILPPISLLIETFHFQMDNMRYLFSPERFRQLSEIGEKDLIGFYNNVMTEWKATADTEIAFRNGTIDGIPVAGKIDRIEYLIDGSVNIIDFKTGTYDKKYALAISAAKPLGGSYRRQLLFYKLMFEQHISGGKPVNEVCLQYTRADYNGVYPKVNAQIGEEEIALFKTLINDIWEKINKLEFENGCNSTDCKWCNFVKNNIAPNDFNNPDIDDLDDEG